MRTAWLSHRLPGLRKSTQPGSFEGFAPVEEGFDASQLCPSEFEDGVSELVNGDTGTGATARDMHPDEHPSVFALDELDRVESPFRGNLKRTFCPSSKPVVPANDSRSGGKVVQLGICVESVEPS